MLQSGAAAAPAFITCFWNWTIRWKGVCGGGRADKLVSDMRYCKASHKSFSETDHRAQGAMSQLGVECQLQETQEPGVVKNEGEVAG
eukprot:1161773-Pelagomonas_calceolata.AAC.13